MRCQKCTKNAVVHLTEVVSEGAAGGPQEKRTVEIHLCLHHAIEAGLLAPQSPSKPQGGVTSPASAAAGGDEPLVAVPAQSGPAAAGRSGGESAPTVCPVCGADWNAFKESGVMGCPHDYEMFTEKLLPLLKRAQEGATEHIGKVPTRLKSEKPDRQVLSLRLRKELRQAVDAENYEQAARLRDELRRIEEDQTRV